MKRDGAAHRERDASAMLLRPSRAPLCAESSVRRVTAARGRRQAPQEPLHPFRAGPPRRRRPRPLAAPRHQQRQREPRLALVLQPPRGERQLRHRRRASRLPASGRRRARPARSRDTRGRPAAGRDGSSSSRPRGTGRARRAQSRRPISRGRYAPPRSASPARGDRRLGRGEARPHRLAPLLGHRLDQRQQRFTLGARDRHELAAAGAAALAAGDRLAAPRPRPTMAFTSPCRAGSTAVAAHRRRWAR